MSNETVTAGQLHASSYNEARRLYRSVGWTLCGRPVEGDDGARQPRVDLAASGLIAVSVPASEVLGAAPVSAAVAALGELAGVPTMQRGEFAVLFFSAPGLAKDAPRQLQLDNSLGDAAACFRALHGESNPGLPCQGTRESWLTLSTPPAAPQWLLDLCSTLNTDEAATDATVVDWLRAHFEPTIERGPGGWLRHEAGAAVEGLSRDEVAALLYRATGWTTNDFSSARLSRCADACQDLIYKHRSNKGGTHGAGGYLWLIRRRPDVPLRAPNGVNVETIDGTLLELARSLHLVRENHPARVRERQEALALAEARAKEAADVRRLFGGDEVRQALLRQQPCGLPMPAHYVAYHVAAEHRRRTACEAMALPFVALPFATASCPGWYEGHDLATVTWEDLYRSIVARFAAAKREVA